MNQDVPQGTSARLRAKVPLFFKLETLRQVRRAQLAHVCHALTHSRVRGADACKPDCAACAHKCTEDCTGCLSDIRGLPITFNRERDPEKPDKLYTGRGTSQMENLHRHLRSRLGNSKCSPLRCHNRMLATIYDWSIDRKCQNCDADESIPKALRHSTPSLLRVNSLAVSAQRRLRAACCLPFPNVEAPIATTREKLGCECHAYDFNILDLVTEHDATDGASGAEPDRGDAHGSGETGGPAVRRIRARGDGRCGQRAVLHAAGQQALEQALAGESVPADLDLLNSDDPAVLKLIQRIRLKAIAKLEEMAASDPDLLAQIEASFPDEQYASYEEWLEAMKSDDSSQANSSLWRGGGTWLLYALAALLGIRIVISNYNTDDRGQPQHAGGPPIDVADFGPNVVHLAQLHGDDGAAYHFDLLVDIDVCVEEDEGNGPSAGVIQPAIKRRQSGIDFLQSISGLGALTPEPFYDKPSRPSAPDPSADERLVFEEMHRNYDRQNSDASSKRSYSAFARDWTELCKAEAVKRMLGEPARMLRLKTKAHLTQYYDRLQENLASADAMSREDVVDSQRLRHAQLQGHTEAPAVGRRLECSRAVRMQ